MASTTMASTTNLDVGSYGTKAANLLSQYEDECVGSCPPSCEGIVVSRIEDGRVYVSDWHISGGFQGEQLLEQFEEAKHNQDFAFEFSSERELREDDRLDGADPVLQKQLRKQLSLSRTRRH